MHTLLLLYLSPLRELFNRLNAGEGAEFAIYDSHVANKSRLVKTQLMYCKVTLTFRHHASYILDSRTATPQSRRFMYLVNTYI